MDQPITCGSAPGRCCAGTGCCAGGACQQAHGNGLGQSYYDCGELDQWTESQAIAAAQAFAPGGTVVDSLNCPACKCATAGGQAAVWCYAGSGVAGLVRVSDTSSCAAAQCPISGLATVHPWH